jgi:CheY-like chemotaxis protein
MTTDYLLVVEDSAEIQLLLKALFEGEGYHVKLASDGAAALEQLRSSAGMPFLILLDLMMPGMDGFQFRNQQKADPALAHIPVVIMTADSNVEKKSISMDVKGYIKKPLDVDSLLQVVAQYASDGR